MEEDAICTWMAGDAKSKRRFEKGGTAPGFVGIPTQKALLDFWGDALPNFPKFAHDTLQKKGVLYADGKEKYPIMADEVLGFRMAIVSYNGAGKYTTESKILWYDDLPDHDPQGPWRTPDGAPPQLPAGQGWWPVVSPNLSFETRHRFWQAVQVDHINKKKGILVICFYQILEDGKIVGWWIFIDLAAEPGA